MRTAAFCEYDEKARLVLQKHWPDTPIYNDVRTLTGEQLEKDGITDIGLICGGYPCQPFSNAGKRQGEDDDRHLWPEFFRLIQEIRPPWVLCENVAGHISMGLDSVLADLESEGYGVQTFVIPACAVGAYHRRDRIFIVGYSVRGNNNEFRSRTRRMDGSILEETKRNKETEQPKRSGDVGNPKSQRCGEKGEIGRRSKTRSACTSPASINVADSQFKRRRQMEPTKRGRKKSKETTNSLKYSSSTARGARWLPEPPVGRVANGVPRRVDRLSQLGNAVVPQIPEIIGRAIMEADFSAEEESALIESLYRVASEIEGFEYESCDSV
jgi:DNA (cytosine-5)-methyltransferase 1